MNDEHMIADDSDFANEESAAPAAAEARRNEHEEEEHDDELLDALLVRIHSLMADDHPQDAPLDVERARRLLEASSGDVDLAASLYWEDYFASVISNKNDDSDSQNASRRRRAGQEDSSRRIRRRTSSRNRQAESQNHPAANNDDDPVPAPRALFRGDPEGHPPQRRDAEMQIEDGADNDPQVEEGQAPQVDVNRPNNARARQREAESVSVSDDEAESGPIMNIIGRVVNRRALGTRRVSEQVDSTEVGTSDKAVKTDESDDEGEEAYLSESDWILQEDHPAHLQPPLSVLWGGPSPPQQPPAVNAASSQSPSDPQEQPRPFGNEGEDEVEDRPRPENIVAEDDGEDEESEGPNDEGGQSPRPIIPPTWCHAGFTASSCSMGLSAKPPTAEELTLMHFRHSQNSDDNQLPPPYHCMGVTALLSVVTALMYSGASVQGNEVNEGAKKPFVELSEEDRKREFDSRLVDALTALLFLAAKVSMERKKKALAKREEKTPPAPKSVDGSIGESDLRRLKEQMIQRRLLLCPTCRWEDDVAGEGLASKGKNIMVATSYTNVQDLRCYVRSNIGAFTSQGGCALFLETIARIHGKSCIEKMLRRARRKANNGQKVNASPCLVSCTCEDRQKEIPLKNASNLSIRDYIDSSPTGFSCASTELISLLLTGQVYSSFDGWTSGGLGIGFLSSEHGEIGKSLKRPKRPVWVLRGETNCSVLWYNSSKEKLESTELLDRPGQVLQLCHWNCWYGHRNKTEFQVVVAKDAWKPPKIGEASSAPPTEVENITQAIIRRRREARYNVVSSDEHQGDECTEASKPEIPQTEIDRVQVHPDDIKFYPGKHHQWRFIMGDEKKDADKKLPPVGSRGDHWTPYFRLNSRQRLVVETKFAPKINRILWTRWPGAKVEKFDPETPEPVV